MEARDRHDAVLAEIADEYRSAGYDVVAEPTRADLPASLHDLRPDLVARKATAHIAVEVKVSDRDQGPRLAALANAVRALPGWELRIVVVPRGELWEHGAASERTEADIDALLGDAEALAPVNVEAALLLAWAAAEATLRATAVRFDIALPSDASAPALLGRLAYEGLLDTADADALRTAHLLRNAAAHGYRADIRPEHVATLIDAARRLLTFSEPA